MNTKVNEGKLISGKEALIALANGEEVQWATGNDFQDITDEWQVREFLHPSFKFRLKPRTITINGIEVPCCGKDYQCGDVMYILNSLELKGYSSIVLVEEYDKIPPYWWRTEEEAEQVVAALHQVFGGSHDN